MAHISSNITLLHDTHVIYDYNIMLHNVVMHSLTSENGIPLRYA